MYNDGTLSAADVAAVTNRGGFGNGMFGDGAWWIIILFLFAMNGGWGNGGYGMNGMAPWMLGQTNSNNDVQRGFDQSAVINGISGINSAVTTGFGNVQTALCNGFSQAEISANARQMADMQQTFGIQTALQQCCCDNRAATADLKYTIATENCADRAAVSDGIRDVIASNQANTQAIMDKLCALELDGVKQRNADLLAENNALKFAQSQTAQDGFIQNAINNAVARVNPTPIPAYMVQNPNCCSTNWNCCCGA